MNTNGHDEIVDAIVEAAKAKAMEHGLALDSRADEIRLFRALYDHLFYKGRTAEAIHALRGGQDDVS